MFPSAPYIVRNKASPSFLKWTKIWTIEIKRWTSNVQLATGEQALVRLRRIECWMGKDEETDLWPGRKAARVFGANHKDRWTATKYQSRQPCCGPIVKIGNFALSKPWWSPGSRVPKGLKKNEHRTSNVQHRTLNGKKGTQRWLKLIQRVPLIKKPELLNDILEETEELIKIFVTSIKTAEKKQK